MGVLTQLGSHRLLIALRSHDTATYEHCLAVGDYAQRLALAAGIDTERAQTIGEVGRLHDVGKMGVPSVILKSGSALSRADVVLMRDHAAVGGKLVAECAPVAHLAPLVRAHHERIDGCGYPDGLRAEQIPLETRFVSIADTFDALTSGRPYRPAVDAAQALTILTATRGLQWDPDLVDLFVAMIDREGVQLRAPLARMGGNAAQ
jgi:HD-GYP domain-containing protein (c-di-GMP phosphodiesterase class II)